MPGLVPGIHVLRAANQGVDGRDKPGHDGLIERIDRNDAALVSPELQRRRKGGPLCLTSRRPLPYMPRVREIGRSAVRDPVAG